VNDTLNPDPLDMIQSHAAKMAATINISGIALPRLSFGLGSLMRWAPNHAYPLPTDSSLEVRQAIDAGFRHFNTSDLYTNNASAAKVLRESGLRREEIFLSLKLNIVTG
jgi:diketogulonate reductase-like aldo/keto reductase